MKAILIILVAMLSICAHSAEYDPYTERGYTSAQRAQASAKHSKEIELFKSDPGLHYTSVGPILSHYDQGIIGVSQCKLHMAEIKDIAKQTAFKKKCYDLLPSPTRELMYNADQKQFEPNTIKTRIIVVPVN